MNEDIRHIVFDIGHVLIHWDPELPYRRLIPDDGERRWFMENVCTPEWNAEQDRGRPWPEAEALLIETFPEHETLIRAYRKHWHDMVPHAVEGTADILRQVIDDGLDVTMLTNFAADTFLEAQQRFPELTWHRGVTVSGEVKLIKPDPAIYDVHVRTWNLDPEAILFIDDSPKNVESARQAGWNAVRFVDAGQLRRDLRELGILPA